MQKIIRIIVISLFVLFVSGCAATRKAKERRTADEETFINEFEYCNNRHQVV